MPPREYRKRYVAFRIKAYREVERWEFIAALQEQARRLNMSQDGPSRPWLTAFGDNRGILRCAHTDKDTAIELLRSITQVGEEKMPVEVETVKTSGTIKKAKSTIM